MKRYLAFRGDAVAVAHRLLGQRLVRNLGGCRVAGRIVEVEAYLGPGDAAAHTYGGRRTARNESMYLGGGHAYVYFTYGMHHCLNVVTGRVGEGVAVLVRALEPVEGLEAMYANRATARSDRELCSGPARLTQALALSRAHDRIDLRTSDVLWIERERWGRLPPDRVLATPRIGVDYAGRWARRRLRFLIKGNPHVSRQ